MKKLLLVSSIILVACSFSLYTLYLLLPSVTTRPSAIISERIFLILEGFSSSNYKKSLLFLFSFFLKYSIISDFLSPVLSPVIYRLFFIVCFSDFRINKRQISPLRIKAFRNSGLWKTFINPNCFY